MNILLLEKFSTGVYFHIYINLCSIKEIGTKISLLSHANL